MPVKNYVMETLADTSKAEKKLGFKPKIGLDEGLKLINNYYR
jgi:UDP-glucose 4-epimerase